MKPPDATLLKKLAWVLVLKLLMLTVLWWAFVRDQRVEVDGNRVAQQFLQRHPMPAQGDSP